MVALLALLLILALFGGLGFAVNALWWVLAVFVVLWLVGWVFPLGAARGGRRWYYW